MRLFRCLIGQITSLCFDLRYEVSHLIDVRWSAGDISRRISRAEISGGLEVFDGPCRSSRRRRKCPSLVPLQFPLSPMMGLAIRIELANVMVVQRPHEFRGGKRIAPLRSEISATIGYRLSNIGRDLPSACRRTRDFAIRDRSTRGTAGRICGKTARQGSRRAGRKNKKMWPIALESMLGVLGLKILLIEDDAATARTLALRTPVDRADQRFGNMCLISAMLLPKPSQPRSPPLLTVVAAKRRGSKYG